MKNKTIVCSSQEYPQRRSGRIVLVLWAIILIVSDLPEIVSNLLFGTVFALIFWTKIGILAAVFILSTASRTLNPVRPVAILLLLLASGRKALSYFNMTPAYIAQAAQPTFLVRSVQFEGSRLLVAGSMILTVILLGKQRKNIFLVKGDLTKWNVPGTLLGVTIMVLTFLFFNFKLPSSAALRQSLPLMPASLFIGGLAAFDEEIQCRATLLPHLIDAVDSGHAVLMTSIYFGLAHYFGGVPSGIVGFFIVGGLGLLWAIMMLRTKGIYMSWLNHFLTNVPTFVFWTISSVTT